MAKLPRSSLSLFDGKNSLEEASKNWNNLPSVLSMRLCEWIAALTHPKTGAFPNGISPRQLDRLAHNQIANASRDVGRELKPIWKSNNHLGVMLWNEVKAGRVVRLHKACYVGNFHNKPAAVSSSTASASPRMPNNAAKAAVSDVVETVRNDRLSANLKIINAQNNESPKMALVDNKLQEIKKMTFGESSQKIPEFECCVCKFGINETGFDGILKCIECNYQTHMHCAYPNGSVPENLLKRATKAISNWRCYDCKRCHLCGGKDDSSDGLLLCDGCDAGEHMGCQRPALNEVPAAPWFCSLCHDAIAAAPVKTAISTDQMAGSPYETSSALIIDEYVDVESTDQKPNITGVEDMSSPDCPSNQSDPDSNGARSRNGLLLPPAWHCPVKMTSPPLSDETPEIGQQQKRRSSDTSGASSTPETKPIRPRLGKREADEQNGATSPPRRRRRRGYQPTVGDRSPDSECADGDSPRSKSPRSRSSSGDKEPKYEFGIRKCRKEKDESELLPFMSEDLPLLNEDDAKSVQSAKLWSVDVTASFMERMGYAESARAFKREEIDGAALLLLRRQDLLLNLGLKLGPALKTYKFVRYIQSKVRSL